MTEIFGLANNVHQVYGHGDSGTEQFICRMGAYGSGDFPPFFKTREAAERYVATQPKYPELIIVPLQLL